MPNEFISYCSFLDTLNIKWTFYSGLVREPLCLFFMRPKDDGQDKVLWGKQAKIDVMGQNEKKRLEPINQNNAKKPGQKDEERSWKYGTQYQLTNNCDAFSATGRSEAGLQEVLRPLPKGDETPTQEVRGNFDFFLLRDFLLQHWLFAGITRPKQLGTNARGQSSRSELTH